MNHSRIKVMERKVALYQAAAIVVALELILATIGFSVDARVLSSFTLFLITLQVVCFIIFSAFKITTMIGRTSQHQYVYSMINRSEKVKWGTSIFDLTTMNIMGDEKAVEEFAIIWMVRGDDPKHNDSRETLDAAISEIILRSDRSEINERIDALINSTSISPAIIQKDSI